MKQLIILTFGICLLLLSRPMFSQKTSYIPMVNSGAEWFETFSWMPTPWWYNYASQYYLEGDTTFNNKEYLKLYKVWVDVECQEIFESGPDFIAALREDALTQKVWIVEGGGANNEILYFDFALQVGDTVPTDSYFSNELFSPITVFSIDTIITYDGLSRRKWTFQWGGGFTEGSVVVEGIGSINGLLAGYIIPIEWYWEQLFCFSINSSHIYPDPNPYQCILPSDTCVTIGIESIPNTSSITLYPNPVVAGNPVRISGIPIHPDDPFTVDVYDLTGRKVASFLLKESDFIIPMPAVSGLYVINIYNSYFNKQFKISAR